MARGEFAYNGRGIWCSFKRTTLIVCLINIVLVLYVIHNLYDSLYMYPFSDSQTTFRYTPYQIRKMEEANQIRKASEPTALIKLVKQLKNDFLREDELVELPQHSKQKLIGEILAQLRSLDAGANSTQKREAVEMWRKEKLKEAKGVIHGKTSNSNILLEEAGIIARALSSDWADVSEEIGLWIPVEVINKEHDDKPEGEEDFDSRIIPGRQLPPECHAELHTDYGGAAVRWGLTHPKESAYECCMACLNQAKRSKPGERKCNIWVYCPSETGCHSPDIYEHKNQECWLKYFVSDPECFSHADVNHFQAVTSAYGHVWDKTETFISCLCCEMQDEKPRSTFKDRYSESYRKSHPNAPLIVPWVAGVVSV